MTSTSSGCSNTTFNPKVRINGRPVQQSLPNMVRRPTPRMDGTLKNRSLSHLTPKSSIRKRRSQRTWHSWKVRYIRITILRSSHLNNKSLFPTKRPCKCSWTVVRTWHKNRQRLENAGRPILTPKKSWCFIEGKPVSSCSQNWIRIHIWMISRVNREHRLSLTIL